MKQLIFFGLIIITLSGVSGCDFKQNINTPNTEIKQETDFQFFSNMGISFSYPRNWISSDYFSVSSYEGSAADTIHLYSPEAKDAIEKEADLPPNASKITIKRYKISAETNFDTFEINNSEDIKFPDTARAVYQKEIIQDDRIFIRYILQPEIDKTYLYTITFYGAEGNNLEKHLESLYLIIESIRFF